MSDTLKKISVETCRVLIGLLFIFSGFVKAVDPLGSAYKFHDYFVAFGMPWMDVLSLPASFILSAIEFSLGACLLFGVYRKLTSLMVLGFMIFMTILTFYLAIKNPVTDCGCFGDALVITNWETFFKNIILLSAAIIVFSWKKHITPLFSHKTSWLVTLYTYLFILSISTYCYKNLPILDFRPYKVGANIPSLMTVPEGAPHDEYETTFTYEKDGVQKEFNLDNYPAEDSTWTFVDSKSVLTKKGYQPPIHDFTITNAEGLEITDAVLADTSYSFLLISQKLEKADDSNVDNINEVYDFSQRFGYNFYCLTASTQTEISNWVQNMGAEYSFYTTDEVTLKTIIRSNPGLLLLKNGTIINKWHHNNIPANEALDKPLEETKWGKIPPKNDLMEISIVALILIAPLAFIFIFDFMYYRRREKSNEQSTQSDNTFTVEEL